MAWGAVAGRSEELARALGGQARCFFPPGGPRPPAPVRWALSAVATAALVRRCRPGVLIVTNPPVPAGLVGWAAGRAVGARVVLDSHPGAFGAQGDRVARRLQWLHRWLARRVDLSMVADDTWREVVESWGAEAVVVHEAPGEWQFRAQIGHTRPRVLYVGRFARDEPWREVLGAAARLPDMDIVVTGDPSRVSLDPAEVPANVELAGFLDPARYRQAVYDADAVLSLTTEPGSVMRAGCEAVWAGRPLIVTGWPAGRKAFPYAVHVDNDAASIAAGLRFVTACADELSGRAAPARRLQEARWHAQRSELARRLGMS